MEYIDIYEVKRSNIQHGFHFFDAGAMRFFNSRISGHAIKCGSRAYFVTSEKFDHKSKRFYSVRECDLTNGKINTLGDFQEFSTSKQAWNFITKKLLPVC
jgi:hypothetical protein